MEKTVLVVDDQVSICEHIRTILEAHGYLVKVACHGEEALEKLSSQPFDIMLADMKMPGMDGLALFQLARKIDPDISGVIMTAYGSISSAVQCIKQGIADYLEKPFEPESLLMVLEKVLRERQMIQEIRDLRKELNKRYAFGNIIGKNHKMQEIYSLIRKVAPTEARVFITGETGVGKELVAKAIHFNSARKKRPFVAINCGALAETLLETELFGHEKGAFTGALYARKGKFEYGRGGTVFLDEVGDISAAMQVKLLRVLQEKKFERVGGNQPLEADVRIISATNQDIKQKISRGEFRVELFYRLNVVPIHIPPLRERIEDIPLLVKHFLGVLNRNFGKDIKEVSPRAIRQLMEYHWPGNVRELENVLERAWVTAEGDTIDRVIIASEIQESGLPSGPYEVDTNIPFKVARSLVVRRFEKAYLYEALKRHRGNVSRTARNTGINTRTMWRKLKEYGLDRARFAEAPPRGLPEDHVTL